MPDASSHAASPCRSTEHDPPVTDSTHPILEHETCVTEPEKGSAAPPFHDLLSGDAGVGEPKRWWSDEELPSTDKNLFSSDPSHQSVENTADAVESEQGGAASVADGSSMGGHFVNGVQGEGSDSTVDPEVIGGLPSNAFFQNGD